MTRGALQFLFLWIILKCLQNGHCFNMFYKTCMDVLTDLGQNATDGEYVMSLENGIGVSIYCHGKFYWYFTISAL